jgi:hypothetical protein
MGRATELCLAREMALVFIAAEVEVEEAFQVPL